MAGTVAVSTATSAFKKVAKAKKPSTHPPFSAMIVDAVKALKERTGSSRHAILKYILTNYILKDEKKANLHLKLALKKGVSSGALTQVKGAGASGSFKVVKEEKTSKKTGMKSKADKTVTEVQLAHKSSRKRTKETSVEKLSAKKTISVKAANKDNKTGTAKKQVANKIAALKSSKKATAKKPALKKATKNPVSKKSTQKTDKKRVIGKSTKK